MSEKSEEELEEVVYDPQSKNPLGSFQKQQNSVKNKYLLRFNDIQELNK